MAELSGVSRRKGIEYCIKHSITFPEKERCPVCYTKFIFPKR